MRLQRLRLELRMELAPDKVRMIRQLHHLHVSPVRRRSGNPQAGRNHRLFVFAIEFVTMPVPLADLQRRHKSCAPACSAQSCKSTPPAASFRPTPPLRATRAICKSPGAASPDRTRSNSLLPAPPRSARTRCTPSASPGKCQSTELSSRAHSESQSAFPQCRVCQIPRARESRHNLPAAPHSSCRRSPAPPPQSSSDCSFRLCANAP